MIGIDVYERSRATSLFLRQTWFLRICSEVWRTFW
jgi:hypothetical protein